MKKKQILLFGLKYNKNAAFKRASYFLEIC